MGVRFGWALGVLLAATGARAEEPPKKPELWAGHQVVHGARKVPILGELQTRTDSFFLAEVVREGDEIRLLQRNCRFEVAEIAGVKVKFREEATFPPASILFRRQGSRWIADAWSTQWQDEDVDQDGKPGATVTVDAPVCGGTLQVGAKSQSLARATEVDDGLRGEVRVKVAQKILGTSGGCLKMVAADSEEKVSGTFAYVPVPAGSTCQSLLAGAWPAKAPERAEPEKARQKLELR